jgi:hypothetical protein
MFRSIASRNARLVATIACIAAIGGTGVAQAADAPQMTQGPNTTIQMNSPWFPGGIGYDWGNNGGDTAPPEATTPSAAPSTKVPTGAVDPNGSATVKPKTNR